MLLEEAVAPTQGRGLKLEPILLSKRLLRRSYTGAWIETDPGFRIVGLSKCRSYTGAWIETTVSTPGSFITPVAPTQGRGLKPDPVAPTSTIFKSLLHRGVD
jgi:hypothetical protein